MNKDLKELSAIDYIDRFEQAVFNLTDSDPHFSVDISDYETLEEGQTALKQQSLSTALHLYGSYSIENDDSLDTGDIIQVGSKMFLLELSQFLHEDSITITQYNEIKERFFSLIFIKLKESLETFFSSIEPEKILFEDIIFFLYEYTYRSPVHTDKYNFDVLDIRRHTLGRIEISTMNKYQDYKSNQDNFENNFLEILEKFNSPIKKILNITITNKEVEYRTSFLNSIYFNIEHFLSDLIQEFEIPRTDRKNKQGLLKDILAYFSIEDELILSDVTQSILDRCIESNEIVNSLFSNTKPTKQKMTDIFLRIINMRNSLHSNGFVNKTESHLSIGKLKYKKVTKGKQHNSMGLLNTIVLFIFMIYILEKIIDASFNKIGNNLIEDKYTKYIQENLNK